MSKITTFIYGRLLDVFAALMFWLWQFQGVERAGNVFLFFTWTISAAAFLASFSKEPPTKKHIAYETYLWVVALAWVAGLVWAGHPWTAATYLFASLWHFGLKVTKTKVDPEAA
jgi:hypothetical protein